MALSAVASHGTSGPRWVQTIDLLAMYAAI